MVIGKYISLSVDNEPEPCPFCGIISSQKFTPRVVVAMFTTAGRISSNTFMLISSSMETTTGLEGVRDRERLKSRDSASGLE